MTKEELEKEAEEWVISNTEIYDDKFGLECEEVPNPKEAYIASAEPRERRIEELEKACEETQELLDKQIEATYRLDKENAELKHTIATVRQEKDNVSMHAKAMEVVTKTRSDQFTKAKNIIKNLMIFAEIDNREYEEAYKEAEQFINEVYK